MIPGPKDRNAQDSGKNPETIKKDHVPLTEGFLPPPPPPDPPPPRDPEDSQARPDD